MLARTFNRSLVAGSISKRFLHGGSIRLAKNDESTIDSYRLPSQTSIHEWEFQYDFIPKTSEPKIPPITPEAVKQDIAHDEKSKVETEMLHQEVTSVKVEANSAHVFHGGQTVASEPEFLHDRGSKPIDASHRSAKGSNKPAKPANREKYVQSSLNPNINKPDVVNLGSGNEVHHKASAVDTQARVVDDIEHDNLHHQGEHEGGKLGSGSNTLVYVGGVAILATAGYYYTQMSTGSKLEAKPESKK